MANKLKPSMTHREFSSEVQRIAEAFGYLVYFTWRSWHSPSGYPDFNLCRPPRLIICELKTEEDTLTFKQKIWAEAFKQCPGLEYYLWKPSQLEDIVKILARK